MAPPGKFPPGTLDFWTVVPGRDEATLHLSLAPLASTTACSDAQGVVAVANVTSHIPHYPRPITRTPMIVAGAPAIALRGLPVHRTSARRSWWRTVVCCTVSTPSTTPAQP